MRVAVLIALCLLLAPITSAQGSRDLSTLYLHDGESGLSMDEVTDGAGDSGLLLLDSSGEIGAEPSGLTFPLAPALDADLSFDGDPIEATIVLGTAYLGGAAPTTAPVPVTVTLTIQAGSTTIASGTADGSLPPGAPDNEATFTFSMAPSVTRVAQADNLVAVVDVDSDAPTGPFFLKTSGDSSIVLPLVTSVGGGVSIASSQPDATVVAGDAAAYNLTVSGIEGAEYALSVDGLPEDFAATFTPANGTLGAEAQSVVLDVTVPADTAAGLVAFNATLSSGGAEVAALSLTLNVTAVEAGEDGSGGTSDDVPDDDETDPDGDGSDGNVTADDGEDTGGAGEEQSPGIGALPLLALVALAGCVARRR